ncbi:Regulator of nonsense transcripts 2 [Neolecta irregularis DAH-3]|uniref:Regulator of nonsense transcripts 2 n=1 Tax=Neolecta irregularis (strain DAH-3) TaxID=1198029 RepID=A0A1U7LLQ2_NEOID|nr:Regulator of nonsense transcripts 2 [Neolecta irregularis DAH-3]|eukprot:OLL23569.1 Regulator of nonsense transcripts 2 [Neolecta irregularis DAH-3]
MSRERRADLLGPNVKAWAGENVFQTGTPLDSSLKKNTAFIKRLRTSIAPEHVASLLKEIQTLSLEKYLSEIVSGALEGILKCKTQAEVAAAVEIISALHQRFTKTFTPQLALLIARGLATPSKSALGGLTAEQKEKKDSTRLLQQRILLRHATEFWMVGILRTLEDAEGKPAKADSLPFPLAGLQDILDHDKELVALPLVVNYVKWYKDDIFSLSSTLDTSIQKKFRTNVIDYFATVSTHISRQHEFIKKQGDRNDESYIRSGEMFEDRAAAFEKLQKTQEKMVSSAQTLADMLELKMPDLTEAEKAHGDSTGIRLGGGLVREESTSGGIWEDDDQRRFYTDLVDISVRIPHIYFEKKGEVEKPVAEVNLEDEGLSDDDEEAEKEDETEHTNRSGGAQVDSLLLRLGECSNRELIDQICLDFCYLNSKASRNRLVKAKIPRGRIDLLPYYARMAATLKPVIPEITNALITGLVKEFKRLQRRKDKDLPEERAKNIRFLSEMIKFNVVSQYVIWHCLKLCVDDFCRPNVMNIVNIFENCGKFLLKSPETSSRMANIASRKFRCALSGHDRALLDGAIVQCNPPDRPAIEHKQRSLLELYLRKLLYVDLSHDTYGRVLKQLRKMDWDSAETRSLLSKLLSKPWLSGLHRNYHDFTIPFIDDLMESIKIGLEEPVFENAQKRVAEMKYLGELYIYKLVDTRVIMEVLYMIISLGHDKGLPQPGKPCLIDRPGDWSRVRLVLALLEACGMCFNRGVMRKKLDTFLEFFQYYLFTKEPMPLEIQFAVQDTFAPIRPKLKLCESFEEAKAKLDEVANELGGLDHEDEEEVEENGDHIHSEEDEDPAENDNLEYDGETAPSTEIFDDEQVVLLDKKEIDPADTEEFDREFAKMMTESLESRKHDRKGIIDVPLPLKMTEPQAQNLRQAKPVSVPSNSSLALATKQKLAAEKEEQKRIKNLVLRYEQQSEVNELMVQKAAKSGMKVTFGKAGKNRKDG